MLGPVDEVIREVERAFPDLTIIVRGNRVAIVSRSKQTEAQAAQAEDLVNTIIQAAYTAPMDALPAPTTRRTASPRFPASSPLLPACRSVRKPPDKWPT